MIKRALSLVYILAISCLMTLAAVPLLTENSKVSLLTCTPNEDAIYTLFGHSSIRVEDNSLGIDNVYNYGVFDYESDNFIYRFVKGETDYIVQQVPYSYFIGGYAFRGVGMTQQILNLTLAEKQNLLNALIINCKPENRVYRYNFFYDNCATRPRDIIEKSIRGKIDYKPYTAEQTYRDLLRECLAMTSWSRFGINIVIGSGADKIITERQKDFLPEYLFNAYTNAEIIDSEGIERPILLAVNQILEPEGSALNLLIARKNNTQATNYPLYAGYLLFFVAVAIFYLSYSRNKPLIGNIFSSLLFLFAGIGGCIVFFLMFFSEHPCVDANWNLAWLNPLALIIPPLIYVKSFSKYVISYHFINFALLLLFLVCIPFIPQTIEIAFIPYILTICLCSGWNILKYRIRGS